MYIFEFLKLSLTEDAEKKITEYYRYIAIQFHYILTEILTIN